MNIMPKIAPSNDTTRRDQAERELLKMEARIGSELFGPLPKGHSRQFFCLDKYTWIWHEVWRDNQGQQQLVTTRYDVRPNGVLKSQDGQTYQVVTLDEARNLYRAVELYAQRVSVAYHNLSQGR